MYNPGYIPLNDANSGCFLLGQRVQVLLCICYENSLDVIANGVWTYECPKRVSANPKTLGNILSRRVSGNWAVLTDMESIIQLLHFCSYPRDIVLGSR